MSTNWPPRGTLQRHTSYLPISDYNENAPREGTPEAKAAILRVREANKLGSHTAYNKTYPAVCETCGKRYRALTKSAKRCHECREAT